MNARESREKGNVLLIAIVALLPVLGLVVISLHTSMVRARELETHRRIVSLGNDAVSALELAKGAITAAGYDTPGLIGRNDLLGGALVSTNTAVLQTRGGGDHLYLDIATGEKVWSSTAGPWDTGDDLEPYRRVGDFQVPGGATVPVWTVRISELWSMIEVTTTQQGTSRTARCLVREHDSFSRFAIFTDRLLAQPVSVRMSGDIHANHGLHFMYGGWDLSGFMSAVDGFTWDLGATWLNVGLSGGYDSATEVIPLPSIPDVRDRSRPPVASMTGAEYGAGYVYVGSDYDDATVQLAGDSITVTARNASTSAWQTVYTGSVHGIRRVYTVPRISSLGGDLNGSLSVISEGTAGITISNSIRYVDDEGDPAWLAVSGASGADAYTPNPDYDGNSVLGIVAAGGDVTYGYDIPTRFELHGAVFAAGKQTIPGIELIGDTRVPSVYDPAFLKDHVFTFGSTVCSTGKFRGVVSGGVRVSGFTDGAYLFDESLNRNPPPYFLQISRPVFKGIHLVDAISDI